MAAVDRNTGKTNMTTLYTPPVPPVDNWVEYAYHRDSFDELWDSARMVDAVFSDQSGAGPFFFSNQEVDNHNLSAAAKTGDFVFDATNAKVGGIVYFKHNQATLPDLSGATVIVPGHGVIASLDGIYKLSADNYFKAICVGLVPFTVLLIPLRDLPVMVTPAEVATHQTVTDRKGFSPSLVGDIAQGRINAIPHTIELAASAETEDIAVGLALTFHLPHAFTLTEVFCGLSTVAAGSVVEIDMKQGGTSVFTTRPTIDDGEETSLTAATPPVLDGGIGIIAKGTKITIEILQIGSTTAGQGLKVYLTGTK